MALYSCDYLLLVLQLPLTCFLLVLLYYHCSVPFCKDIPLIFDYFLHLKASHFYSTIKSHTVLSITNKKETIIVHKRTINVYPGKRHHRNDIQNIMQDLFLKQKVKTVQLPTCISLCFAADTCIATSFRKRTYRKL